VSEKTGTAVAVGIGSVAVVGLLMWGFSRIVDSDSAYATVNRHTGNPVEIEIPEDLREKYHGHGYLVLTGASLNPQDNVVTIRLVYKDEPGEHEDRWYRVGESWVQV